MPSRTTIAAALVAALGITTAFAQTPAPDLAKFPDWSGQWRKFPGQGNQWDQTKPLGRAQQAPLTREYQAIYDANLADQAQGGQGIDPTGYCIPFGMPRMMTAVYPFEILITPTVTYFLSEYNMPRRILTDGRDFPKEMEPKFVGYSIGKWMDEDGDGRYDALEVETRGLKGPRVFEGSGIPLHEDNQTVIKERFALNKANKDNLQIEITVIDNALTRPWTVLKNFRRDTSPIWFEYNCSEDNHHVAIEKENYFLGADGKLMPTRKGQKPPDLSHFK
jgi:hypothetical protein